MVKYLILDFGMVLGYPPTGDWNITYEFKKLINMDKIDLNKLQEAFVSHYDILDRKILTLDEEYKMFIEFYGKSLLDCNYEDYDEEIVKKIAYNRTYGTDAYILYDNVREDLIELSKKYKLLLLSDNWPDVIESMKRYNIYDLFTKVYVSSIYNQLKKDGYFFDNPIRDFDIKKGEAIFVDDKEELLDVAITKDLNVRLMNREDMNAKSKYEVVHDLEIFK